MEEFKLDSPPTDCISCVRFAKKSNLLVVSSWDKTVSVYDTDRSKLLNRFENRAAVLSCDLIDENHVCLGGLDCDVKVYNFEKKQERLLGKHKAAVSCVLYVESLQYIISSSWDKTVKIWDAKGEFPKEPLFELPQTYKVYSMDISRDMKLLLSLDNRQIVIYDLNDLSKPLLTRDCLLKYNTRPLCALADGTGYVAGSVEGRVGVEYFSESMTPFSFRCHRKTDPYGVEVVYPVNAIAVHPVYGTFATGGADGTVCVWDADAKKRLAIFNDYIPGIACLSFNHDGTKLAIACSYTFEQGTTGMELPNHIAIRQMRSTDVMPKKLSSAQ